MQSLTRNNHINNHLPLLLFTTSKRYIHSYIFHCGSVSYSNVSIAVYTRTTSAVRPCIKDAKGLVNAQMHLHCWRKKIEGSQISHSSLVTIIFEVLMSPLRWSVQNGHPPDGLPIMLCSSARRHLPDFHSSMESDAFASVRFNSSMGFFIFDFIV